MSFIKSFLSVLLTTLLSTQAYAGFLSPDWFEVTHPGVGTNRYAYCNNDPINCTDRNGNAPDHDYGYGSYHGSAYMGSRQDDRDHDAASPGMTALDYSQRQIDLRNHMFQSGSRQSLSEDPAVQYQAGINLMMQFGNVNPRHRQAWFVEQFHYGVYAGFSTGHLALATPMGRAVGPLMSASRGTLPNAAKATIDVRKLTEYALNPNHPVGKNKARVFQSVLGYNLSNYSGLQKQIQSGIKSQTARMGKVDSYGTRYTVDIPVRGPYESGTVTTGWIITPGSNTPSLTTLFVK